jgi:hypothetical protein
MSKYEFVNLESFERAAMEIQMERIQKDIRDYYTFQADPEQTKIWQRYLEIEQEREREELARDRKEQFWAKVLMMLVAAYMVYTLYQCLTYVPR